jgi:hypothetical protein
VVVNPDADDDEPEHEFVRLEYNVAVYGDVPPDHVAMIVAVCPRITGFGVMYNCDDS